MCGLAGFFGSSFNSDFGESVLNSMGNQIAHRGPDDNGTWIDANTSIGLVHRRLAIQDLSREGHQPMFSKNKRYVLVYNGEIYNFQHLRQELKKKGAFFNGYSDTEVLLAAITLWGIKAAVKRLIGMFAFALWDRELKTLVLARDRIGGKPLYYGWQGKSFLFWL